MEPKPAPCPGGCSHSDEEHYAFDAGVAASRLHTQEDAPEPPYADFVLREIWRIGYSVTARCN